MSMHRRAALGWLALGTAGLFAAPQLGFSFEPKPRGMGLVIYDCRLRRAWMKKENPAFDLFEPLTFLQYCQQLGAGGMQAKLGVLEKEPLQQLRDYAEQHGLFIDAIVDPPREKSQLPRFEAEIRTAAEVGVQAARTVIIPGRRYERFTSLKEFREFEQRGQRSVELAAPIVEKYRVPLAIENHKDQRNEERLALLKHIDSEYVGVCLDTGNSFALLEDAYGTIADFAPWAKTVHLKDQALQAYEDGFLLGDIPLGQGSFDLKRMVKIVRQAQPKIRFTLELITRDPLKVPCLAETYWAPMPKIPATDLARTLRYVKDHPAKELQQVSSLPPKAQVALEDTNIAESLRYAREELAL